MRIPKAFPHRRICISCRRKNINGLYCPSCRPFQAIIPPADHILVSLFIQNPDVVYLKDEFNFPTTKAAINSLSKLRVPVRKYTLYYLLYNVSKYCSWGVHELKSKYEFNSNNLLFKVVYHNSLPEGDKEKYSRVHHMLFIEKASLVAIQRECGIHHELLQRCKQFLVDRKIVP